MCLGSGMTYACACFNRPAAVLWVPVLSLRREGADLSLQPGRVLLLLLQLGFIVLTQRTRPLFLRSPQLVLLQLRPGLPTGVTVIPDLQIFLCWIQRQCVTALQFTITNNNNDFIVTFSDFWRVVPGFNVTITSDFYVSLVVCHPSDTKHALYLGQA